jgi:hypothetical protein
MREENQSIPLVDEEAVSPKQKTAVIVIHGMGEQRPMETLRGLVQALWACDPSITNVRNHATYSKPDSITGNFELRRITTRNVPLEDNILKRVDFFEFYWAHLMTGNTLKGVTSWLLALLIRSPSSVPSRLFFPWLFATTLLILTIAGLTLAALKSILPDALKALNLHDIPTWWYISASTFSLIFSLFSAWWLAPIAGDAARYLSPLPDNVAARQKIREAGVDLLSKLHASGLYDRIIVIGHSLGSVIGYDVLNCAWGRLKSEDLLAVHANGAIALEALNKLERAAGELLHSEETKIGQARVNYRNNQRTYQRCLAGAQNSLWSVTDFITLGCPLSKADVLIAKDGIDFTRRKSQRELPTSPPWLEKNDVSRKRFRFSYPVNATVRIPHHAAVFAPVVWTNIYFGNFMLVFGDIVSGRVAPQLGRGVLDVHLRIGLPVFRHLDYWKISRGAPSKPWLAVLRRAVNLKWLPDEALWSTQAEREEIEASEL